MGRLTTCEFEYKAAILDLDGTLLNKEHKVTEYTINVVRRLSANGVQIVIATGRSIATVYHIVSQLALDKPIPVVCFNGAKGLWVNSEGKIDGEIFNHDMPEETVTRVLNLAQTRNQLVQYYLDDGNYANAMCEEHFEFTRRYKALTGTEHVYITDNYKSAMQKGMPSKLLVMCEEDDIPATVKSYRAELEGKAKIFGGTPPFFVEILHKSVDKGAGVKLLCQNLGIDSKDCIGFGDGNNDIEFLQFVGKAVAMKNSSQYVKDAADEVSEFTNNEDGVAKHLENVFKI